jgi:protocatechuate 3,4-dioxygenase beta subunit
MKNTVKSLACILILSISFTPSSQSVNPEFVLRKQDLVTPKITFDKKDIPISFSKNNNLRRKVGSPFVAKGGKLVLTGFVLDLFDKPIENVIVKIWQANFVGYYNHLLEDKNDFAKYDVDFENTGTSVTDTMGRYSFFTIIPGFYADFSPHINIIVEIDGKESLITKVFFPNHPRNIIDGTYKTINHKKRKLLLCDIKYLNGFDDMDGLECNFNIKLDLIHQRRN